MANVNYEIESGQLVIRELPNAKIVCKTNFEVPVLQIISLPDREGCLVLLDWGATKKPTFENLLRVNPDGSIGWKAQLPDSHDAFTDVTQNGDRVDAHTWNGYLVDIDLKTGQTRNVRFAK
jgi:hypothetical protein